MKKEMIVPIMLSFFFTSQSVTCQDTFSIVAVDVQTGEVGSAGASCVDLFQTNLSDDDFLGELVPNVGAINTQAYYSSVNQNNATNRMLAGDTPDQIIQWLMVNDVSSQPENRQYGIAAIVEGSSAAAAHTGISTDNYKGHITGPNYSIQGNILLGQEVLDNMETQFLNEDGDLACKLMAALQGAKMVGADTRCNTNGTSSLFAFVKVSQPQDPFGIPSFRVSVRTHENAQIEPIDSLQTKFNLTRDCSLLSIPETPNFEKLFFAYPNPSKNKLTIENKTKETFDLYLIDNLGKQIHRERLNDKSEIDVSKFGTGIYFLKITNEGGAFVKKIILE